MIRERIERFENSVVGLIARKGADQGHPLNVRIFLGALKALSGLYLAAVQLRLFLYRIRILRDHTLGCQVISIGNLTVGGTGKTPVVEIFARELQKEGRKVAILSRGYRRVEPRFRKRFLDAVLRRERSRPPLVVSDGKQLLLDSSAGGDEPYMLATNLPGVAVLVDKNRVKSGRFAVKRLGCDTLLLDDGFQYLDLNHRMRIVLVDRTNPFGNEHVLPRGILREPVQNLARAGFLFITKSDGTDTAELKSRLRALNPRAEIIECRHCARHLRNVLTREMLPLETLRGMQVVAVSAIAAPAGFESALELAGARVVARERFADHHRYTQQEIEDIVAKGKNLGADAVVTTEKDAVRLPDVGSRDLPVYFLRVDIELLSGEEDFRACIARICFRGQPEPTQT